MTNMSILLKSKSERVEESHDFGPVVHNWKKNGSFSLNCSQFLSHCQKRLNLKYRKFPKYSDTQKICYNHFKILTMWLYHRVMSPNDADGMANSVDPGQTAPL